MEAMVKYEEYSSSLVRNKAFLLLLIATGFSSLGASMFIFTQTWYIVKDLNLGAAVGAVMISSSISQMLFLFIGGVVADHWNKSKVLLLSDLIRTILVSSIVLIFILFNKVPLVTFIIYAFLFGVLSAFFNPTRDSIIPLIVHSSQLARANSIIYTTNQLSVIIGPFVGGIIIGEFSYTIAFIFVASMLLLSTITVSMVNIQNDEKKNVKEMKISKEVREGIKYLRKSSVLSSLLFISIFVNFFIVGPLFIGLPIFVDTVLKGGAMHYSFLEGSLSVGVLVGSIIMVLLNIKKRRGKLVLMLLLCLSVSFLIFSKSTELWTSVIVLCVVGMLIQMTIIPVISIIQNFTEEEYMGRIMSLLTLSSMGLIPLSYGLTSLLLMWNVEILNIIFGCGISLLGLSIVFWFLYPVMYKID
ncbi:hypothetical protein BAMA_00680 [Bacillus manliponensis]|uniref:Major facilitator superfamily (MFS) profile domain-containing protein n=1 Tax=Bacillus manliponensis TaxID=574376 RepID=A0A073KG85_9BACI|nr:MFS transporter [Bacillus manliponensis]KEK21318.1 hypothetical protein BAMA_00680 [Bacillus manliponensis]